MRTCAFVALCVFVLAGTPAGAEFYRWVDRDGKEFFTNEPAKVPQEYRDDVTTVSPDESRVQVGGKPTVKEKKKKAGAAGHDDKYGRGEKYWKKRAAAIRGKLRDQQEEYDLIVREIAEEEKQPVKKIGAKNNKVSRLEKKRAKLERAIEKTRRALEVDLPEEARKADAYPGWLRE